LEAEAYDGPSLIIAYSHCIAHGINMTTAMKNQKAAVDSGQWPLYRYNPALSAQGENPFILDSRAPKMGVKEYLRMENRFKMLELSKPEVSRKLFAAAQEDVNARWAYYEYLASRPMHSTAAEQELKR
jgi:pyruvate-ferredoxin/flavodoxin oxidoreductase